MRIPWTDTPTHTWDLRGWRLTMRIPWTDTRTHTWDRRGVEVDNEDTRALSPLHAEDSATLYHAI